MANINAYRITKMVITTPMIIKTHAHTNPPKVIAKLSGENLVYLTVS